MRDRRVGAVLVTEQDRHLLGIFTGRDRVGRLLAERKSAGRTMSEVMTSDPITSRPDELLLPALPTKLTDDGAAITV